MLSLSELQDSCCVLDGCHVFGSALCKLETINGWCSRTIWDLPSVILSPAFDSAGVVRNHGVVLRARVLFAIMVCTMILTCPFAPWTFENHPTEARDVGGYYYLLTTQTQKEIVAVSCPREDGRMVFKPHGTFMERYAPHLILGVLVEFRRRLHPIINDLNLDNILIRMGRQTWTIGCNEIPLTCPIFQEFIVPYLSRIHSTPEPEMDKLCFDYDACRL
ncbi:hypothetical protein RHSIM_Rhsim03G0023600 [Rhododendron simsii]|uniref:Uncharacterized protein n=1 Tax=Rhododendron simsii TaxID=118357 RepID=A0A834LQY0_RHOSS|nr:hypothetical protein RHSIM_Rhsim03G0023600 [Rhododendron simsii]